MGRPLKILAIHFKYLGDAVLMIPALRAIREHHPDCLLHALVPAEAEPLLEHLPWLTRLWSMPRVRGSPGLRQSWPVIRALRAERFDRCVDFGGNDRGAILGFLSGAHERLGLDDSRKWLGRRLCYTRRVSPAPAGQHETLRLAHILSGWDIPPPRCLTSEIHTSKDQDLRAASILPHGKIICHVASSQPKKEWPVESWARLHSEAGAAGLELIFTSGVRQREKQILQELKRLVPAAAILDPIPDLRLFLGVLKRARAFVSGDTGPLHFAAGLGVPTVALFGPTSAAHWRPLGESHRALTGAPCECDGTSAVCQSAVHCLSRISPAEVLDCLKQIRLGEPREDVAPDGA
jgi:ADP-heptose:LPS heptosyltransferase